MARTRTTRRRPANQKQPNQQQQQQRPRINPRHSGGAGVKRMRINKRQSAKWKIKRYTPPARDINVKHRGQVVRKMTVRRSAIYPDAAGGTY